MRPPILFCVVSIFLAGIVGYAADTPPASGLIRSAQDGPWSATTTWERGKVPGAGDRVQVRQGHIVTYDVQSDAAIRLVHVAGTLRFAPDKDTRLNVGLIKIQAGSDASEDGFDCEAHLPEVAPDGPRATLEVGTSEKPIDAKHTALIRLIDCDGVDKNSWPAIVCCAGRMDFHGAPMARTWIKLGAATDKGDATVTLAESAPGWRVGNRIIVTTTELITSGSYKRESSETEERVIKSIDGTTLTLDAALEYKHTCDGEFRGEVANLSRNVIVESADPATVRGHTMYHRNSAGSISYSEFRHLGKENTLGRYSLHFHLVGNTMRGSSVIGASIWDSGNRWLTIHGTNYLIVRDCVGYRSIGHGFFLEDGTEVFNVLDRNLAVAALAGKPLKGQVLQFDRNDGAGFWWANSLNTFTRNVACDNQEYGYRYDATKVNRYRQKFNLEFDVLQPDGTHKKVDIRTLPFVRFEDNECHSDGLYGMNLGEGVDRLGPDERHPFVVRNMKIWATHYAIRPQTPSVLLDNLYIYKCNYGIYHPDYDRHVYRNLTLDGTPSEPFSSGFADNSEQYGALAVNGLVLRKVTTSAPIKLTHYNRSGSAVAHFRNVRFEGWSSPRGLVNMPGGKWLKPPTPIGVPIYFHDYFGSNRTAKVVSRHAEDLLADGNTYREESPLTGEEARVAEVRDIEFPELLHPIDDLPPATVIMHVVASADGKVLVRGTTSDNGTVKRVTVNGRDATPIVDNFAEWEVALDGVKPGETKLTASAEDAAGNVEKLAHVLTIQR